MPTRDAATQELLDRAEIRDLMMRYSQAVDRQDHELLRSIFTEDVYFNYDNGVAEFRGLYGYVKMVAGLKRHRVTMHFMENQTIQVKGDTARMETYANNHHVTIGSDGKETDHVVVCRYLDDLVRVDGHWKVKKRVMVVGWVRDDPIVKTNPGEPAPR